MTDLHYISATDALRLFRRRELSPVELMKSLITRAERVEPQVNALSSRFFERALEQARAAEDRYVGKGQPPRPLEGIPTVVKEEEPLAGEPWTQGSLIFADTVARETSNFGRRILESGAIVHARSTAPEFSCAAFTHSRIWGVTRNPWNPDFAVGGSSGGSAASLSLRIHNTCERLGHRRIDTNSRIVQWRRGLQTTLWASAPDAAVQSGPLFSLRANGAHG